MRNISTLFLLAVTAFGYSQNITLKGKVTGPDDFPLESATVYVTVAKDSTVADYTITDRNGNWELKTRPLDKAVFLKISYVGFANYKQSFEALTANKDFGTLKLADNSTTLNEVVIEAEAPPVRIKKDTLEFNAASFKVRPDSNVETLLKQLPGVDIDADGKITVNGKEVNQILVNGKPFFDRDGKIALKNLPADIIKKVQVSDTKTRQEELSGQKASGNNSSINLTIDDDKNKGYFGKITGGYGSGERYESSALLNYFKGKRKISVLASSNNINSTGFSMDEIFDSMGGGRNVLLGSQAATNSQGITQSTVAGANYNDELIKGFDSSVSYFYNTADTENNNRSRETTFIPDENGETGNKSITTESKSVTDNSRFTHNVNTEFELKPDDASRLSFKPKFVSGNAKSRTQTSQTTANQDGDLSNESDANTFSDADNTSFTSSLYYNRAFKSNKRRSLGISFNNENTLNDAANYNKSNTVFYDTLGNVRRTDIRDQVRYNRQTQDSYSGGLEYFEPVTDSLRLKISANYSAQQNAQNRVAFDYNEATGSYTIANDSLSNYLRAQTNSLTPKVGIDYDYRKFNFQADLGQTITKFNAYSLYLGNNYNLTKNYILPAANASVRYQFAKSTSLYTNYSYSISMPSASQVLPVEDLSNPLFTYVGNPYLDPNKTHNLNISFRDFDFATRSGYNVYFNGNYRDSQIVSFTNIDESAKRTTTYKNISGSYSASLGVFYNKSIKKEEHAFRFSLGANTDYSLTKGFTNSQLYEARAIGLSPWINANYDYGELLTITPSYNYSYRVTDYTNFGRGPASNFIHRVGLQTTNYWPKNVVFGNDFSYNYNSIAGAFRKDFYLWNMSLGYNLLNDHFLAKVKVYDLLNQNIGTSRSIGATTITDQENTVLKRYIMFSVTYSLKQFGPRKKEGERGAGGGGRGQGRRGGF